MSGPIYSPDGSMVWNGTSWTPVENRIEADNLTDFAKSLSAVTNQVNSNPVSVRNYNQQSYQDGNLRRIENLAKVMIDNLNRGDMETAKNCWNQAKMIDIITTQQIFEHKYANEIADGYFSIALSNLNEFRHLYENPLTIGIEFKVQVQVAPNLIELALENSTAFVSPNGSFQYNFLYANLWLYCRRFDLVWKRDSCQKKFEHYFSIAYKLATSLDEFNSLRSLKNMWEKQLTDIKSEYGKIIIGGIVVIILWIFFIGFIS